MVAYLIMCVVGVIIIMLGISNINGNINSIHWYHRQRVTEESKPIFGKFMGIGTMCCGIGVILFGILSLLAELFNKPSLVNVGSYLAIITIGISVVIFTYATIKYNKGIF